MALLNAINAIHTPVSFEQVGPVGVDNTVKMLDLPNLSPATTPTADLTWQLPSEHITVVAEPAYKSAEFQFQLRRLELEAEERLEQRRLEDRARQYEDSERARQHELAMRQLELEAQRVGNSAREQTPVFRVESAVKLIPKFNEHDLDSFLLSFEKIAQLNNFPLDKYAAVLQAHLTGKALKVFTELSVADCQHYPTLKAALLTAYAVVPEVYRKRFRGLNKAYGETHCEFAFKLTTQFKRWLESEEAFSNVERLREVLQMEQFNSVLENDVRLWLLDQKPKSLAEAAKLADQYVAVHKPGRTTQKTFDGKSKTSFNGHENKSYAQKSSPSRTVVNLSGNKANVKSKNGNSHYVNKLTPRVICYYCKKPGHTLAVCRKRLAEVINGTSEGDIPVQFVSTLCNNKEDVMNTKVMQKNNKLDPRLEQH